jgi:hypothetical protein
MFKLTVKKGISITIKYFTQQGVYELHANTSGSYSWSNSHSEMSYEHMSDSQRLRIEIKDTNYRKLYRFAYYSNTFVEV